MTWVTKDSIGSTVGLIHFNGSSTLFRLKELLKAVGYIIKSSSDGTTYNSSGDQITHDGSGSDGMNNDYAWFRVQDPGNLKEYVFQRGLTHISLKWMYSPSEKFVNGTPNATTVPTATDQQNLAKDGADFQNVFPSEGAWKVFMAAQDVPNNGVYSWWACVYQIDKEILLYCDDLSEENSKITYDSGNYCVHYSLDDASIFSTICKIIMAHTMHVYKNRVWDTQIKSDDKYHYWITSGTPDVSGDFYDGPGVWGVDTSDFCVFKL